MYCKTYNKILIKKEEKQKKKKKIHKNKENKESFLSQIKVNNYFNIKLEFLFCFCFFLFHTQKIKF